MTEITRRCRTSLRPDFTCVAAEADDFGGLDEDFDIEELEVLRPEQVVLDEWSDGFDAVIEFTSPFDDDISFIPAGQTSSYIKSYSPGRSYAMPRFCLQGASYSIITGLCRVLLRGLGLSGFSSTARQHARG